MTPAKKTSFFLVKLHHNFKIMSRNFFVYALLFSQISKTTLLLKKIAEMPYFFLHSGTPQLALARYPKKFVFIISCKWDLRGSLKKKF